MKSGSNSSRSYNQVKLSMQNKATFFPVTNVVCLFIYLFKLLCSFLLNFQANYFRNILRFFSSLLGNLYFIFKKLSKALASWFFNGDTVQVLQNWICRSILYFRYCLSNKKKQNRKQLNKPKQKRKTDGLNSPR